MTEVLKIGYQGEKGAYSARAIDALYQEKIVEKVPFRTSYEVVDALKKQQINFGLLPIENSIMGNITHTYDLLLENKLTIIREVVIPIHHALLGLEGIDIKQVKTIYSHPAAISQCEVFLRKFKNAEILPTYDTAGSARMIAEKNLSDTAAIASEESAELYSLKIIDKNIEDYPHNQTRFILVSHDNVVSEQNPFIPYKVSAAFDTLDQHGMLYKCLGVLEKYEVNMSLLNSRPHKTEPWKYHFFLDVEGHATEDNIIHAFQEIEKLTGFVYIFGSYPKFEGTLLKPGEKKSAGTARKKDGPLYSIETKPEKTIVKVGNIDIGGGDFIIIAGPCSVEGRHQMMESAKIAAEGSASILRGGAFKPRTSPYSFQGLGEEGLKLLKEAGEAYKMPIVTEVIAPEDVGLVAEYADMLQVGARNMQNFVLLRELGKVNKPIFLKRGMMSTIKEFLLSAEYILAQGNPNVILCERGIRTFETATRNTLDISAVPLLKEMTHLPVMIDPSHATGIKSLIAPITRAAAAIGADGVMVEVHFNPSTALSDGDQALDEKQFMKLVKSVKQITDLGM